MCESDDEEIRRKEMRKEAERVANMQEALESFLNKENQDIDEISKSFKSNMTVIPFLKDDDSMRQLLWTLNIFLRNRPKNSEIYLRILKELKPEIQKNEIKAAQIFSIFLHPKFNNFSAVDLFFENNVITIFDILNQAAVSDSAYSHFKEILKNKYDEINKEKMAENESEFVKKYDEIVESHKFIHSKSSIEIPIQPKSIQKLTNIIKNDEIDLFQEFASNTNLDFQSKYKFQIFNTIDSIYLKKEISLIEYAAYQGSLKIFKFLWIQPNKSINKDLPLYSICGGNYDIIHIIESESSLVFDLECLIASIELHLYDITEYLTTTKELKFPFEEEYTTIYPYLFRIIYSYNMKYILNNADSFEFVINSIDDETGFTPIQIATYLGFTDLIKVFLTIEGVELMVTCRSGENVLYIACLKGFIQIVKLLIDSDGININCRTDNGMTSLHAVVQNESAINIEIIKLLLSNGININLFNHIFFLIFFLI